MIPLRVRAYVPQQVCLPGEGIMLDSLLMAAVAFRDRLPPPSVAIAEHGELPQLDIPLAKSQCERIYLCSQARPELHEHETRYKNRRFPVWEAARFTEMTRVDTGAGAQKSYRVPYSTGFVNGGVIEWYAIGDPKNVRVLLALITHVGRHRGVGLGLVERWEVERMRDPWPGFPVVRDGVPLRSLPYSWPGLRVEECAIAYRPLLPPYWDREREVQCLVAA
jgi:CRISPR type IV-associated protein Csf3